MSEERRSPAAPAVTRVALAGFGAWGLMHARAIASIEGAQVVAVLARSDASRAEAARAVPGARVADSLEQLLGFDGIDVVNVLLPNHLHAKAAVAALGAGCHVLLEKPLGLTLAECDAVIDATRSSGRLVAVNHELRVSRQWGLVHERIAAGDLGRLRHQHLSLFRKAFRTGSNGWRYDPARVGSWVLEELVHFIDLVLWYRGASGDARLPQRVTAFGGDRSQALSDRFTLVMEWEDGATAVLNQCLGGFEHHTVLEVAGTDGALRTWWSGTMDRTTTPSFELKLRRGQAGEIESLPVPLSGEVFELEEHLRQAYAGFAEGRSVLTPQEVRPSVAVALAAERSWREQRPMEMAGGGAAR